MRKGDAVRGALRPNVASLCVRCDMPFPCPGRFFFMYIRKTRFKVYTREKRTAETAKDAVGRENTAISSARRFYSLP